MADLKVVCMYGTKKMMILDGGLEIMKDSVVEKKLIEEFIESFEKCSCGFA